MSSPLAQQRLQSSPSLQHATPSPSSRAGQGREQQTLGHEQQILGHEQQAHAAPTRLLQLSHDAAAMRLADAAGQATIYYSLFLLLSLLLF